MFLILKSIFKIKIHLFFYVFMFISLITGHFFDFLIFSIIIFVHELGHIFAGLFFKWNLEKIVILPFGGVSIFKCFINTSLLEQFIVTLMGPLFQICFFAFLNHFFVLSNSLIFFNNLLLFFNLLPIFPLDGSKFLYIFLCIFLPFRCSFFIFLFISFGLIAFLMFSYFNFTFFCVLFFLFVKCLHELISFPYIFNKFLLERYFNCFNFKHTKIVKGVSGMYLWCKHKFFLNNNYVSEREYLSKMFDKSNDL